MKILMTSETYFPIIWWAEWHIYYLKKKLEEQGIEVILYTTTPWTSKLDSLNIIRNEFDKISSFFSNFKQIFTLSKDVDIIHSHYSYKLALVSWLVSILRRKPFIITQHWFWLLDPQYSTWLLFKIIFKTCRYFSMKISDRVISTSDDLKGFCLKYVNKNKIIDITNWYDDTIFRLSNNINKSITNWLPTFITIRRFAKKNWIHILIDILSEYKKKYWDFKYYMIWYWALEKEIFLRIKEYWLENNIIHIMNSDHKELVGYLNKSDIVFFPSSAESTSLSCIEAMWMKKIIVASRVWWLIQLIWKNEERGYFLDLYDWTSSNYNCPMKISDEKIILAADNISNIIESKNGNIEKTNNAYDFVKANYTWDIIAKKTIILYNDLIK